MKTGFLSRHDFLVNQSNLFMLSDCGNYKNNQVCLQPMFNLQANNFCTDKFELIGTDLILSRKPHW